MDEPLTDAATRDRARIELARRAREAILDAVIAHPPETRFISPALARAIGAARTAATGSITKVTELLERGI